MKKLNLWQIENLQGTGKGRDCALMGAATMVGAGIGMLMGEPAGAAGGVFTVFTGAIAMGCFS